MEAIKNSFKNFIAVNFPKKPKESFKIKFKRFIHEYFSFIDGLGIKNNWISKQKVDIPFLLIVLALLSIGIVMMYSASYVSAIYETYSIDSPANPAYYFVRQLFFASIGLALMFLVSRLDTNFYKKFATSLLIISFILLIYVLINPMIIPGKEEFKRWIDLKLFSFQPSEIAKLAVIMFLAWRLSQRKDEVQKRALLIVPYLILTFIVCVLILEENHLSATILVLCIAMVMLYMGGFKLRVFITLGVLGLIAVGLIYLFKPDFIEQVFEGYMRKRIVAWLDKDYQPLGARWQTNQSIYAIGSGGLFGLGLGNSMQKHLYVSEPQNDFVFAIVCEELGFFRSALIIALFALLVWRGCVIAMRAKDTFASLLTMGIVFQVGLQTVLNIAVVTDFIPNTGISLPFFSYGGTSIVMLLAEMGLVMSASRRARMPKK